MAFALLLALHCFRFLYCLHQHSGETSTDIPVALVSQIELKQRKPERKKEKKMKSINFQNIFSSIKRKRKNMLK